MDKRLLWLSDQIRRQIINLSRLIVALIAVNTAIAQVTPISPFDGGMTETWESFPNFTVAPLQNGTMIFGGGATIANSASGTMGVYEPSAGAPFGIGPYSAQVHDGTKAAGVNPSHPFVTITFVSPIFDFGAYWATFVVGGIGDSVSISFQTLGGATISTQTFQYGLPDGNLQWQGWHSIVPIQSVSFTTPRVIAFDGLQANSVTVPEPTVFESVVIGSVLLSVISIYRSQAGRLSALLIPTRWCSVACSRYRRRRD